MKSILVVGIICVLLSSCTKKEEEVTTSAASPAIVQASSETQVVFDVNPALAQQLGPLEIAGLEGVTLSWTAGLVSEPITLVVEKGPTLSFDNAQEVFEVEQNLSSTSAGPSVSVRPQNPFEFVSLAGSLTVTWPTTLVNESGASGSAHVNEIAANEDGQYILNLQNPDSVLTGAGTISYTTDSLGVFQPTLLAESLESSLSAFTGSGVWYGYDASLSSFVGTMTAANVALLELTYGAEGHISTYKVNNTILDTPPGSSFADSATEDPVVFDSSSGESLRPWIMTSNQSHLMTVSALGQTGTLSVSMLQREAFTSFDQLGPLTSLSGDWQGVSVSYAVANGRPKESRSTAIDQVSLQHDGTSFTLSGTLAGVESTAISLIESSDFGQQLGVYTGVWADTRRIYLSVSADRQAIGYMLCSSLEASACGDGKVAVRFDAYELTFGMLLK